MKGDYLFKQEMLRKGLKSCIIWIIVIIVFTAIFYGSAFYIYSQSYKYKLGEGVCAQGFSVPFYKCPVEIEVKITGPYKADIYLTEERYKDEPENHTIANTTNTTSFSYKGELGPGEYSIVVERIGESCVGEAKADFKSIDVFILKPLIPSILIGAGVLEALLVFWLISIIIRRRNLTKEMILANTTANAGGKEGGDYYSRLYEDRSAAKHKEYDDIFPHSDGLSDFEKSKIPKYQNEEDSLYQNDYELRKKRRGTGRGGPSLPEYDADHYSHSTFNTEERAQERRSRPGRGHKRGYSRKKDFGRSTGRRIPSRSEPREGHRKERSAGPQYDIEYIPPGAKTSRSDWEEYGGIGRRNKEHGYRRPGGYKSRKEDDDIDWG